MKENFNNHNPNPVDVNNPHEIRESEKFPHETVEQKWMRQWYDDRLYRADDNSMKTKFYILDMYPYPSGNGLHVGHVEGYTATDIVARYKRMNGAEVLHPMGWDAFGLPTENYAINTGQDPREVTEKNINTFKNQCIRTGLGIDWDREIDTSKEAYYKWTQWLFTKLFENDLAYKAEAAANWCTGCQTVISNEQAQHGQCERCESPVVTKKIDQWFLRITKYADQLIDGLKDLDWPESTKHGQINWIGRSEGTEIRFNLNDSEDNLPVFTTKPETLSGAAFIAIAPEHPVIKSLTKDNYIDAVDHYINNITPQSELERKKGKKEKTGVFTGSYVTNPLSGEDIPIWVADYVLMESGSGIVMGVPAHDARDFGFAQQHGLEITPVFGQDDEGEDVFLFGKYKGEKVTFVKQEYMSDISEFSTQKTNYKLKDWLVSRERYWGAPIPIVYCDEHGVRVVPEDQLPVLLPDDIDDFRPTGTPPLEKSQSFMETTCPDCHGSARREPKTLDTFVDSSWYFLRFADPKNNQTFADTNLLSKWLPVDYYLGGAEHTNGHLLYARFITKALHDLGVLDFDEPFKTLRHPGIVLGEDGRKMSKRWGNVTNPDDVSRELGSDTLRIYEMFMGPLDQSTPWNTKAIGGVRKFIDRVWNLQYKVISSDSSDQDKRLTNALVSIITDRVEQGKFNVAISDFMKYLNLIEKNSEISRHSLETVLKVLAPFAPFITEEMWSRLNNKYSIHLETWPTVETTNNQEQLRPIPVQVNGKVKGIIQLSPSFAGSESELLSIIFQNENMHDKIGISKITKIVYVGGKVINLVTE